MRIDTINVIESYDNIIRKIYSFSDDEEGCCDAESKFKEMVDYWTDDESPTNMCEFLSLGCFEERNVRIVIMRSY
jgi:hypothetical protein